MSVGDVELVDQLLLIRRVVVGELSTNYWTWPQRARSRRWSSTPEPSRAQPFLWYMVGTSSPRRSTVSL